MNVADTLIGALVRAGGDTLFGVPGGGPNLELIGAAQSAGMRFVLHHGETAGVIAAATYGALTGRASMAIATRGPGAASAVNGAAQATLDRFPVLVVTDCVPSREATRVAHQRLDQVSMLRPATKWSGRLGATGDTTIAAEAAVRLAMSAPMGAVHLDFDPEADCDVAPSAPTVGAAGDDIIERARALLTAARRPVAIVGDGALAEAPAVRAVVERMACPVLTTYQAAGLLPDGHPQLAGLYTSGAIEGSLLSSADVIITIGLDTVEPMPNPWAYAAHAVVVRDVAAASTFVPAQVDVAGPLLDSLSRCIPSMQHQWRSDDGSAVLADMRSQLSGTSAGTFGPVELAMAVARCAPEQATATVDAGAHFLAIMPFWPTPAPRRLLISNGLATMGFAVPAAIGAALARPGSPVACMVGDGGLGMTLAELETIVRLKLPITVVVFDDAALSLIEIKQKPGQGGASAVRYQPIDFAAVARAMGMAAATAESIEDVERLLAGGWTEPRLIDAKIDPAPYAGLIKVTRG
jgi:acetolactate synthase I/II/III large subunit